MIICKKGDKDSITGNQNVISMQKAIVRLGYKMENGGVVYAPDGSYGTATANGLLSFMKANGLAGNGETFDDKINAVLLIKLSELEDYKSELAIANAKIAELTKQINSANAQIAILKQQLSAEQAKNTELTNKLTLSQAQVASLNTQLVEVTKDRDAKLADLKEIAKAQDIIEKY